MKSLNSGVTSASGRVMNFDLESSNKYSQLSALGRERISRLDASYRLKHGYWHIGQSRHPKDTSDNNRHPHAHPD